MNLGVDKIYAISLTRFKERRRNLQRISKELDIDIDIIDAIDNKDHVPLSKSHIIKHLPKTFWDPNGWVTLGIICCALSHRKAYKAFLESDAEIALFVEDDIMVMDNIYKYNFSDVRNELNALDWGVCWYGKYFSHIDTGKQLTTNILEAKPHHKGQYAGHAYVLNRKSAAWFYKNTEHIKYAADIRLEISPFKQVSLENSLFSQKHMDFYTKKEKIHDEYFHNTLEDAFWHEEDKVNISKELPIKSWNKKTLGVGGKILPGWEFTF
jgi:GR25 family glycosyltransferase involved in LPS biosynthesis|tara:strand:+ start:3896 stop:4696 length:801 start_codon:yes stop_codon:yes gene_type:complete